VAEFEKTAAVTPEIYPQRKTDGTKLTPRSGDPRTDAARAVFIAFVPGGSAAHASRRRQTRDVPGDARIATGRRIISGEEPRSPCLRKGKQLRLDGRRRSGQPFVPLFRRTTRWRATAQGSRSCRRDEMLTESASPFIFVTTCERCVAHRNGACGHHAVASHGTSTRATVRKMQPIGPMWGVRRRTRAGSGRPPIVNGG